MAVMTEFKEGKPAHNGAGTLLAQIHWKGLNNEDVPPGGYKPPLSHVLLQKEVLSYLTVKTGLADHDLALLHQTLTTTAEALHANITRLFTEHGFTLVPAASRPFRGKTPESTLKKLRKRFDKPLADTKPMSDGVAFTVVFSDRTDMPKTINLLRSAFPTDDMIPLGDGQFWETVHDGRNEHSHPLYRCRKVNFVFADGQIAEAQLMTESEYKIAQAADAQYHERTNQERVLEDGFTLETIISSRHIITGGQDMTEPPSVPTGGKPKPPQRGR